MTGELLYQETDFFRSGCHHICASISFSGNLHFDRVSRKDINWFH
uniref:Uncharacterized protein n=1 Tax=uncultured Desulfobacterium sp. TaxID=201089 RepID=E1Y996_9BACT|nr:unknown protein [uncultured Desulfobacterium sp.]